jgi:hypothetical protein
VLAAGRFGRLGRQFGARVHVAKRKVPEHETQAIAKSIAQQPHGAVSLSACRTLEVAILDHRDFGALWTLYVVAGTNRSTKRDNRGLLTHDCFLFYAALPMISSMKNPSTPLAR